MATLTSAVTAEQLEIASDATEPGYYYVDDEAIRLLVRRVGQHRGKWIVDRGVAGTTAASHADNATLTRYYPEAPASGGGGSSSVRGFCYNTFPQVNDLGGSDKLPFQNVVFDTDDIFDSTTGIATIPAGMAGIWDITLQLYLNPDAAITSAYAFLSSDGDFILTNQYDLPFVKRPDQDTWTAQSSVSRLLEEGEQMWVNVVANGAASFDFDNGSFVLAVYRGPLPE